MRIPTASNENEPVSRDGMTTDDLLALTDRFGQLLAMARRINESGTPDERFIVETVMRRAGFTLDRLRGVVEAWKSNCPPSAKQLAGPNDLHNQKET